MSNYRLSFSADDINSKLGQISESAIFLRGADGNKYAITIDAQGELKLSVQEGEKINLISFIIDDVALTAEEGMTWEDWVGSKYDTFHHEYYGYIIISSSEERFVGSSTNKDDEYLTELLYLKGGDSSYVYAHETIVPNGVYNLWH